MMGNYSGFEVELHGLVHTETASKLASIALLKMAPYQFDRLRIQKNAGLLLAARHLVLMVK
jgi:hypothetical protein